MYAGFVKKSDVWMPPDCYGNSVYNWCIPMGHGLIILMMEGI